FYPNLVLKKNIQPDTARAATVELLTAPWMILQHTLESKLGYVIYYRRPGATKDEFKYLIDYLMHYQALLGDATVQVRALVPDKFAHTNFEKAVDQYIDECENSDEIKDKLKAINFIELPEVITKFSTVQIGMDRG